MGVDLSIPRESKRSLYRVVDLGLLLFGSATALDLVGYEGRHRGGTGAAHRAITVPLGIHDDVGLRIAAIALGLAAAGTGYVPWREAGGEHREERE